MVLIRGGGKDEADQPSANHQRRLRLISLVLIREGEKADADQQNPEPAENLIRMLLVATPPSLLFTIDQKHE